LDLMLGCQSVDRLQISLFPFLFVQEVLETDLFLWTTKDVLRRRLLFSKDLDDIVTGQLRKRKVIWGVVLSLLHIFIDIGLHPIMFFFKVCLDVFKNVDRLVWVVAFHHMSTFLIK
jgi:hypothetical protein